MVFVHRIPICQHYRVYCRSSYHVVEHERYRFVTLAGNDQSTDTSAGDACLTFRIARLQMRMHLSEQSSRASCSPETSVASRNKCPTNLRSTRDQTKPGKPSLTRTRSSALKRQTRSNDSRLNSPLSTPIQSITSTNYTQGCPPLFHRSGCARLW